VIIAKNFDELQEMAKDLRRESLLMGLSINLAKTKIMANINNLRTLKLGGEEIEQVGEYKYTWDKLFLSRIKPKKN